MDLEKELKRLNKIIAFVKQHIDDTESKLGFSPTRGTMQYYTILKDGKKQYLSKRQPQRLKNFAFQFYLSKLLDIAQKQKQILTTFIKEYNPLACYEVYDNLHTDLKNYILPCVLNNKEFAQKWAEKKYETKGIKDGERFYITENGEKVRSKSELTIANKLFIKGIKYRYEQPHYMKGFGTVYPDFTILNAQTREEIIWEHFGLMNNPQYVQNSLKKLQTYADNGIFPGHGLIVTYESEEVSLDTNTLDTIIQELI